MSCDRFKYFLKIASYSVPDNDMYAAQSADRHRDKVYDSMVSKKNLGTVGGGLLGAGAMYQLSKPFSDKAISLRGQKVRKAAMLGAGIYAAKKARDYLSKKDNINGGV